MDKNNNDVNIIKSNNDNNYNKEDIGLKIIKEFQIIDEINDEKNSLPGIVVKIIQNGYNKGFKDDYLFIHKRFVINYYYYFWFYALYFAFFSIFDIFIFF